MMNISMQITVSVKKLTKMMNETKDGGSVRSDGEPQGTGSSMCRPAGGGPNVTHSTTLAGQAGLRNNEEHPVGDAAGEKGGSWSAGVQWKGASGGDFIAPKPYPFVKSAGVGLRQEVSLVEFRHVDRDIKGATLTASPRVTLGLWPMQPYK